MTYNQIKKEINRLYKVIEENKGSYTYTLKYINEDQAMAYSYAEKSGNVQAGWHKVRNEGLFQTEEQKRTTEEAEKQIAILQKEIEEEENRRYITAKIKRYKKELEELNIRKTYLEKWLAENE